MNPDTFNRQPKAYEVCSDGKPHDSKPFGVPLINETSMLRYLRCRLAFNERDDHDDDVPY